VSLGSAQPEAAVLVNERAVGTDQDKKYVLVVDADNHVQYREVNLGRSIDGQRIVTAGLDAGERIVVSGLQRVRQGALVDPQAVVPEPVAGL
jgi:multidrug efflux system membrane fusion protein